MKLIGNAFKIVDVLNSLSVFILCPGVFVLSLLLIFRGFRFFKKNETKNAKISFVCGIGAIVLLLTIPISLFTGAMMSMSCSPNANPYFSDHLFLVFSVFLVGFIVILVKKIA